MSSPATFDSKIDMSSEEAKAPATSVRRSEEEIEPPSFEGPEKVLEIWFGRSGSDKGEAETEVDDEEDDRVPMDESDLNVTGVGILEERTGRHPNRKHDEPVGTHDGKYGKPDGLGGDPGGRAAGRTGLTVDTTSTGAATKSATRSSSDNKTNKDDAKAPAASPAAKKEAGADAGSGHGNNNNGEKTRKKKRRCTKKHKRRRRGKRRFIQHRNTPAKPTYGQGLRAVERPVWEALLELVKCQILSVTSNEYFDAYVLSESSLFVYPERVLLKTCGTTTLLNCVPRLLEVAKSVGLDEVEDCFYTRKSFLFPDKQLFPHASFQDECTVLDKYFDGSGYQLGKVNGEHCRPPSFLYITDKGSKPSTTMVYDQTLEVLMTDLDPEQMKRFFYKEGNPDFKSTRQTTIDSGIADLLPGATIDDYTFDPCGYSMNGLLGESYFTIHVTPQPSCSYASFETNAPQEDFNELIEKVIAVFRPRNFVVTLFANVHTAPAIRSHFPMEIFGCRKTNKMTIEFENNYKLFFSHYTAPTETADKRGRKLVYVIDSPTHSSGEEHDQDHEHYGDGDGDGDGEQYQDECTDDHD